MPKEKRSTGERQQASRFQFSLRTLLGLVAALSLLMGMWAWRGEYGLYQFFFGAGLCLVAVGIYLRRVRLILCGVLVLVGIELGISFSARRTAVTSRITWSVVALPVQILDANSGEPIPRAMARVLSGRDAGGAEYVAADGNGVARVPCELAVVVEEYETFFGTRGNRRLSLSGVWVEVRAEGYRPARLFLEKRLGKHRELRSDPLPMITVKIGN